MCREKSMTTARPTVWPARLVPAPLGRTGTPNSAAVATTAAASLPSRGNTTPIGSIAYMLASRENRCRVYASNRTPPPTTFRNADSRPAAPAVSNWLVRAGPGG